MNLDLIPSRDAVSTDTRRVRPPISNLYLGALLLVMALAQASDLPGFHHVILSYQVGRVLAWPLALVLVAGAAVGGIGLLRDRGARTAALVALSVAVLWSALAVQAFARGLALDNCGWFGVHLAQPLRWWILLEDVWFVGLAAWVWRRSRPASIRPDPPSEARAR